MIDNLAFGLVRQLCALFYQEESLGPSSWTKLLDDLSTAGVVIISYGLSKAVDKLPHLKILQWLSPLVFPLAANVTSDRSPSRINPWRVFLCDEEVILCTPLS